MVVLDEQGNTTVAESPAARGTDDHDRTSIRAVSVPAPAPRRPCRASEDDEDDDAPTTVSGGVVLGVLAVLVAVTVGVVVWPSVVETRRPRRPRRRPGR